MVFNGGVADGARLKLRRGGSPRKRRSSMADMTELAALAPTPTPPLKGGAMTGTTIFSPS